MQFGSVEGFVSEAIEHGSPVFRLTVVLETSNKISTVREEHLEADLIARLGGDLAWIADQLTQETIGNELTVAGWEAIGSGEQDLTEGAVARSARYIVRRV